MEHTVEIIGDGIAALVSGEHGKSLIWLRIDERPYCWMCSSETCEHIQAYWKHEQEQRKNS